MSQPALKLALVDDHRLFRRGMISLIEFANSNATILFEADNGKDMIQKLDKANLPDIILMDVNMPGMDGFESVQWLNANHPSVKVLVVSMIENEESVVHMLKLGVKGYLTKDVEPNELGEALEAVYNKGFYYTDFVTGKLVHTLQSTGKDGFDSVPTPLTSREKEFLQLVCSDRTYNEIAAHMNFSPKTIDGYRINLFDKLEVKSRVGLVLYAVKHGLVEL